MSRFELVFKPNHIASIMGSAWIGVNPQTEDGRDVITHDCGSPQELEAAIRDLKSELDEILKAAEKKFADNRRSKANR